MRLTLAGASPGGLWASLGEGVSGAIAKAFPGSSVSYQTSGGGFANIGLITSGKVEMGIAHGAEVKMALAGDEPFKAPVKDLYALAYMYNWGAHQFVMREEFAKKHGITTLQDLADKKPPVRLAVNPRGNVSETINRKVLAAYGITYKDIESWGGQVVFQASGEMVNLMRDRRIDLFGNSLFAPHAAILEVANALPVVLLPLSPSVIEKVSQETGADPYTIQAGTYTWQDRSIPTVALGAMVLIRKEMSEVEVYDITKALVENIDVIRGAQKTLKALTPEFLASQKIVPYHPGAARYYREKGLLK